MTDRGRRLWPWLAAIVTGIALDFVQGVDPWWPVMWIAPIPLLVAALSTPSLRQTFRLAAVASLVGLVSVASYYVQATAEAPPLIAAVIVVLFTLPRAVPLVATVMLWRVAVRDSRQWYAALVFPLAAAAVDFGFSSISSNGTLASWANSQMHALPVLQTAALGGTAAVVFVVTLPAAAVAVAFARRGTVAAPPLAYGVPALLVTAALGLGFARLAETPSSPRMAVGLVAADDASMDPSDQGGAGDPTLSAYLEAAAALAAKGAEIVILPEKIETLDEAAAARARATLAGWTREHGAHLLAGFTVVTPGGVDNRAWLFDREGELQVDYAKQHLVPLVESRLFRRGDRDAMVTIDGHRLGVAICKDMDFPRLARRYGRAGVEAMLAPAWDFDVDDVFHSRMAVLRGIEQGFALIRAPRQGVLSVSDGYGRMIAEAHTAHAPVATLFAQVPLGGFGTLYGRFGDAFGWACVAITALIVLRRPAGAWRRSSSAAAALRA